MSCKILIIDDDVEILELLSILLKMEGFEVVKASTGLTGIEKLKNDHITMVILDLGLPDLDGEQVCKIIRKQSEIPILILSAKESVTDKVLCLEYGADDYITKPFENMELLARVKAIMRRCCTVKEDAEQKDEIGTILFKDIKIDMASRNVYRGEEVLILTPKEFDLLVYFANNRGKTLSREKIVNDLWGKDTLYRWSRSLDVHVQHLRQKIEINPKNPNIVKTISGIGYKIEE